MPVNCPHNKPFLRRKAPSPPALTFDICAALRREEQQRWLPSDAEKNQE
jgi:hypothetical protein